MLRTLASLPAIFILYFYGLSAVGLLGPDEPRYAFIGRDMAASGDWVTPRLWGEPWFEKPALLYWMTGASFRAGLGDDLAPRLPVALASVAFLIFYYVQLRREFGDAAAATATAILGTSAGWLAYSQIGVTDLPMSAAFAASMLVAMRWLRSGARRELILAGILLGVAVLAKGLVPLALAAPLAWAGHKRRRDLWMLAAGCLACALPWYAAVTARHGGAFLDEFFLKHHFGRYTADALQHVQPFWFYVPVLAGALLPWSPLLALLFRRDDLRDSRRLLLFLWVVWGFLFFSLSRNKLPGYLLPLVPGAAALIGVRLLEAGTAVRWLLGASAGLLASVFWIARILPDALAQGLFDARGQFPAAAVFLGLALGAAAWYFAGRSRSAAVAFIAIAATVAVVYIKVRTYPALDQITARPHAERNCVPAGTSRSLEYGLYFYAGRKLPACE